MQVYEDYNGATVKLYGNTYGVEDLSQERFQKLVDSQVNNIAYNTKTKTADMNNRWGQLLDRWKAIGVNITGHKSKDKYIVDNVELDFDNIIMRNIEQYKQSRNRSITEDKTNQCGYTK
jgi:hypothetical protein